ncbi:MAG: hypothetical protein J1G01_05760 [Clostridiales bacterium]|nr:hypothetical protein [Clostridiales bacterium]
MKKFITTIVTFVFTVLGCFIPLLKIDDLYKILLIAIPAIGWLIIVILDIIEFCEKNIGIKRKKRIRTAQSFIMNATHKIILFGGNLSWAKDYSEALRKKIEDNCCAEVYYDKKEYGDLARQTLETNIQLLKRIGCKVYQLDKIYGLKCIFSDPLNDYSSFQVLTIEKLREYNNSQKNRYKAETLDFNNNKDVAKIYQCIYSMIANKGLTEE